MYSHSRLLLAASLLATLTGCNTGGFTQPAGAQCVAGQINNSLDYISPTLKVATKAVDNKANAQSKTSASMPPGTYTYVSSSIYYADQVPGNPAPLEVGVGSSQSADGVAHQAGNCVRNASLTMTGIHVQANIPDSIFVAQDYSQAVTVRSVELTITDGNINYSPGTLSATKVKQASDLPAPADSAVVLGKPIDVNAPNPTIIMNSTFSFEYRVYYQVKDKYSYYVSTILAYNPLPPVNLVDKETRDANADARDNANLVAPNPIPSPIP